MQIHELNKRPAKINKAQVNEVDLVGPNSIFNMGKQVLKDPSSLLSNTGMGAAKQAATQASAASSAAGLAQQGYKAGGSATKTTPQQQLQKVKMNTAVQQLVKNIASQWPAQGNALYAKIKTAPMGQPTTESVVIKNLNTNDPDEQALLAAIQKQELESQVEKLKSNQPNPEEKAKADEKILADINTYSAGFQDWATTRLSNLGIKLDKIESDTWAKEELQKALRSIALTGLSAPNSPGLISDVAEYFYIAIATAQVQQADQRSAAGPAADAGDKQLTDKEIVAQSGVPLTSAQIEALGQAMRKAANGETTIRNTGNTLLNAISRLAGFKVAET